MAGQTELPNTVDCVPPWYQCIVLALQHYLLMFGSIFASVVVVSSAMCVGNDLLSLSQILGTILFVSGIITILQTALGVRLPIVQGGSFSFVVPTLAILNLEKWRCPEIFDGEVNMTGTVNGTSQMSPIYTGSEEHREVWQARMREIQGAIILASLFQIVIGGFGLFGALMRFVGPLTVGPVTVLIGLSLFRATQKYSSTNWWIALLTLALVVLFSQYLYRFQIRCVGYRRSSRQCFLTPGFPVFKLYSVAMSVAFAWLICYILTISNAIPDDPSHWGYKARTDTKSRVLSEAPWFRFPYPGQWGKPTFSTGAVFGMVSGVLTSIMESIGDYFACARVCEAPIPPRHAMNRGILVEGIGCILAGIWGTSSGTTSYSQNIGAIAITKVGSRRVVQVCAILLMLTGVIGKFGAIFVAIPDPVIGGLLMPMFGMIVAVGISNFQFINLNSSRNLIILGLAIFVGLTIPNWISSNPDAIETGNKTVDQLLTVLASTNMFVGGVIGFVLDNTLPGTEEERGILAWREKSTSSSEDCGAKTSTYDVPWLATTVSRWKVFRYLPIFPYSSGPSKCSNRNKEQVGNVKLDDGDADSLIDMV